MSRGGLGSRARPLIAHVVYRFDVGGMENGVINLVNRLPREFADHFVIALTEASPSFCARLNRTDVQVLALRKAPGPMARFLPKLWRTFRAIHPDVVHTRNVGTLEAQVAAWAAGVPVRIHGEHGWDVGDLAGENVRMLRLRRILRHFVHHQVALSSPTQRYLLDRVGVPADGVSNICNGVDTSAFSPASDVSAARAAISDTDASAARVLTGEAFVVGAVGRLAQVKNLPALVDAFATVRTRNAEFAQRARLAIVGDGPALAEVAEGVAQRELQNVTWFAGARSDVAKCLRTLDLLCLPSLAEGISNAILEAMACGVPIVATDVGGNAELVADGSTGLLVANRDVDGLSRAIENFFTDHAFARRAGTAARSRAVTHFSLDSMIAKYHAVYARELERAGWPRAVRLDVARPARSN